MNRPKGKREKIAFERSMHETSDLYSLKVEGMSGYRKVLWDGIAIVRECMTMEYKEWCVGVGWMKKFVVENHHHLWYGRRK